MPPSENIILEYRVQIWTGETVWYADAGVEIFLDEHGVQWAKFVPRNGYAIGRLHMTRTEGITIVRDDRIEKE